MRWPIQQGIGQKRPILSGLLGHFHPIVLDRFREAEQRRNVIGREGAAAGHAAPDPYRSGRNSSHGTPVAFETASTRPGGTSFHFMTALPWMPIARPSAR